MSYFYERFEMLCIKNGISPSAAAKAVGLSNAAASGWADGSAPRKTTIRKLAEFFGVPVSYFEDGQKENPTVQNGEAINPDYFKLSEANRGVIDDLIARLLKAQSFD